LQTNLMGTFRCAHAAANALRTSNGAIVNVASIAGIGGSASSIAYAASKAGIVNMTRNLAKGLAPMVRVNAVAPGFVLSPWSADWSDEQRRNTIAATWLGRGAAPSEIAEAILFLSAGPKFVNAHTLVIDGGR
ncbi:SDR family NAD(P)-dependent oxidoreductase, partial [Marinobacter salarius]|uniref:SDR family NAD(P)-dependent oxidoreductase n=1 Tax=Marinobacter salarius TaxID=1420917 RepID=UPI0032F07C37